MYHVYIVGFKIQVLFFLNVKINNCQNNLIFKKCLTNDKEIEESCFLFFFF